MRIERNGGPLRLLVIASTFPAREGDGTPSFVDDLARREAERFTTLALVPRVPGAARRERRGKLLIERFPYFFRRWEGVADGAILENVRSDRWLALQVPFLVAAEMLALRRAVRRFKPDVIHVHWIVPQGIAALAVARSVPWVVTTLGGDVYALQAPVWRGLKARVLRRARTVTTMNREMREHLVSLGSPAERTIVLPMGVDLGAVRPAGAGVDRVPLRVLFAGRLVEKKGLDVLLRAMRQVTSATGWSLDVVGDGPLREALRSASEDLSGRVRFLGQQTRPELARSMYEADLMVFPSVVASSGDQDGLPVTLLEAMAAGCAIVASRLPGIDEAIEDGVSGVLVPTGDERALGEAIDELLGDPERRRRSAVRRRSGPIFSRSIGSPNASSSCSRTRRRWVRFRRHHHVVKRSLPTASEEPVQPVARQDHRHEVRPEREIPQERDVPRAAHDYRRDLVADEAQDRAGGDDLLHIEPGALQQRRESVPGEPIEVVRLLVEPAEEGDGEHEPTARTQHPLDLLECPRRFLNVFEHLRTQHDVVVVGRDRGHIVHVGDEVHLRHPPFDVEAPVLTDRSFDLRPERHRARPDVEQASVRHGSEPWDQRLRQGQDRGREVRALPGVAQVKFEPRAVPLDPPSHAVSLCAPARPQGASRTAASSVR